MKDDNSNESQKIVIDTTILRTDAGKRLDSGENSSTGITLLNEGSGIGFELFEKEKNVHKHRKK